MTQPFQPYSFQCHLIVWSPRNSWISSSEKICSESIDKWWECFLTTSWLQTSWSSPPSELLKIDHQLSLRCTSKMTLVLNVFRLKIIIFRAPKLRILRNFANFCRISRIDISADYTACPPLTVKMPDWRNREILQNFAKFLNFLHFWDSPSIPYLWVELQNWEINEILQNLHDSARAPRIHRIS